MRYTVVMPFCYLPYKEACEKTWKFDPHNMLLVDNTEENLGIQRAYNMGIDKMRSDGSSWLIHLSASIRFGEPGGLDFIDALHRNPNQLVVENGTSHGWHLIAFNRKVIEAVGRWDMNYTPYRFDDLDYSIRIKCAFGYDDWKKVRVDLTDMGQGHGVKLGRAVYDPLRQTEYFAAKWGRRPDIPGDTYMHPFNNPNNPVGYWPSLTVGGVVCRWNEAHWDEAL